MLRLANTFDVKETGVESAEPFHVPMLGAMTSRRAQLNGTATGFRVSSVRVRRAIFRVAGRTTLKRVGFSGRTNRVHASPRTVTSANGLGCRWRSYLVCR